MINQLDKKEARMGSVERIEVDYDEQESPVTEKKIKLEETKGRKSRQPGLADPPILI